MNSNLNQSLNKWPSYPWIIFLQVAWLFWNILTLGLTLITAWIIVSRILENQDVLSIISDSRLLGLWFLTALVWLYWHGRLKGVKLSLENNRSFLTYCSAPAKRMIWRALRLFYKSSENQMNAGHLLSAMQRHKGTRIVFVRLGITTDELTGLLISHDSLVNVLTQSFTYARTESVQISWDHLLKALFTASSKWIKLLDQKRITQSEALAVIDWTKKDVDYKLPRLRSGLLHDLLTPRRNINRAWTARPTPVLDRFSRNLTELAQVGLLTSAKVRKREAEEAIRVLSRSEQNSLVLVGEPGVGKTSIVGDIALKMIKEDIPALEGYKLISLDIGAMVGSNVSFQQLFARAVTEASGSGNTILFIGNLDQLGKAKAKEGFDLSAILLGALEHNLQLIGTSDPLNYKKYIENNANLVQLFSRVNIPELNFNNAVLVAEDLSYKIERKQKVLITLKAIKEAVELSQRYLHTAKLPDKAIDLLDEAAVYVSRRGGVKVTKEAVEAVMSSKTNIPIGDISASEKDKLLSLEENIHKQFINQDEAVRSVVEALKRARLGVSANKKRPIGTFLFLGPTGVGKTELAKSLAKSYFGNEDMIIRLDMSEYQTKDSVYRLLGASVNAGDIALAGGTFTEAVKKVPFAVVLLDEIEKAHPEILNIFLQVLDEGRLTDNLGNTVDFTHTIIIATSNAQARLIQEQVRSNIPYEQIKEKLTRLLIQESFKPEFINRFDGVIVFKPLTESEIEQIAEIKLNKLIKHLKDSKDIELVVEPGVIKKLAQLGYDPAFGARPLERIIREKIETKVASELLKSDNKRITITLENIT